jgi:hypothetical protein
MNFRANLSVLCFMLAAGTVSANDIDKSQLSGFLGDYSQLQPAKDREGVLLYLNDTADYSAYKKIMFTPVEIFLAPNPDYKGMRPDVLKQMADRFLDSFRTALTPEYQIVHEPGPDVLTVRAAITGVQLVKPSIKATDLIPIKALYNIGRSAAGNTPLVAEMTAEMEVLSPDGNRLVGAVASRRGEKTLKQGEEITWDELQAITDYWAKGFRSRLDQLRDASK